MRVLRVRYFCANERWEKLQVIFTAREAKLPQTRNDSQKSYDKQWLQRQKKKKKKKAESADCADLTDCERA